MVLLINQLVKQGYNVQLLLMYDQGELRKTLQIADEKIHALHKKGRWDVVPFLVRYFRHIKALDPDYLISYLGVPNLVGLLSKLVKRKTKTIWGIRGTALDYSKYSQSSNLAFWLICQTSRFADLVISNSYAGAKDFVAGGAVKDNIVVVHNGIDVNRFLPDAILRQRGRKKFLISKDNCLVGVVARFAPMKDHENFIHALAKIEPEKLRNMRFVFAGAGSDVYKKRTQNLLAENGLMEQVVWFGKFAEMPPAL